MGITPNSSNFREISIGRITPKTLYRSNHPVCNGKQVKDIILSATNAGIKTVINLSDSFPGLRSKVLCCPWFKKLFDENNVIALNMSMKFDICDKKVTKKLRAGMEFMIGYDSPYLIHCEAGIDRTGFMSILLESFMGAGFDEIVKDHMLSFVDKNEYSENDHRSGSIFIRNLFSGIKGSTADSNDDLQELAVKYLTEKVGLNDNELMQ